MAVGDAYALRDVLLEMSLGDEHDNKLLNGAQIVH